MSTNSEQGGVYGKIAEVMRQVDRIPKRGRNDFHGYDYVLEADLVEHLRPLMVEAGLIMVPSQRERVTRQVSTSSGETTITEIHHVFTIIDTEDGSTVEIPVWGAGADGQDKGPYKAFTGAQKYALMKGFMVATGDDPERDNGQRLKQRPERNESRPPKREQSSGAEEGGHSCPDCGGPIWDNREDDESALNGGKRPNFKCRDRDGCNWASWDSEDETFGTDEDDGFNPEDQPPTTRQKAKVWQWFKDAYPTKKDAERAWTTFAVKHPDLPSNPEDWDALNCETAYRYLEEVGKAGIEQDKLPEQPSLV